ncbi:hypothetical protein [Nonomuraea guangzhouensis]|uniref:Uncharacterized protein n=1 Tax=Nonomuraea guangzhouensis TaxID=1291555 RepID=A0ABW4GWT9_9ACTN|nr:hypothetical protein [Nonomuraea guangzhouensis]
MSTTDTDPMARHKDFYPIFSLEKLQLTIAKLDGYEMRADTPVFLARDDGNEPTSYTPATELQATWWDYYTRCAENDEGAALALFFLDPAEHPEGVAGEGSFYPIGRLADLRDTLAKLGGLPGETFSYRTDDNSNHEDSYESAHEVQVAWWDGQVQCEPDAQGARQALFIW